MGVPLKEITPTLSAVIFGKVTRLTQREEVGCYSYSPEPSQLDHTYKCLSISRSYLNKMEDFYGLKEE